MQRKYLTRISKFLNQFAFNKSKLFVKRPSCGSFIISFSEGRNNNIFVTVKFIKSFFISIEAIPRLRNSGFTAKQQIILYLREKRRTPTTSPCSFTHKERFWEINFITVFLCSSKASSVSKPGKFYLTSFTNFIQEVMSARLPNCTTIKTPLQILIN